MSRSNGSKRESDLVKEEEEQQYGSDPELQKELDEKSVIPGHP
jgi:hypothetical protein